MLSRSRGTSPQAQPNPLPPCTGNPEMFDRPEPYEDPVMANRRMAQAAHLCQTACPRLEECRRERKSRHKGWTAGVVAGAYQRVSVPRSRRART